MASVDEFLETLSEDYGALYKESAILKNKLKVLVDKVEEYRSTEDAMRMALLTAQKMSKEMMDEAETKSRNIVAIAEDEAKGRIEELQAEIREEQLRLEAAKRATNDYIASVTQLISSQESYLEKIREISFVEMPGVSVQAVEAAPEPVRPVIGTDEFVDETARSVEQKLSQIFESGMSSEDAPQAEDMEKTKVFQPVELAEDDEPTSPRPKFDFSNLQFGANYDTMPGKKPKK